MTYAELGYLRALHEVGSHECATTEERDALEELFRKVSERLKLDVGTAEVVCEALEK